MGKFVVHKSEKELISLRLPAELLREVDNMAVSENISRNELIIQMIQFALSESANPSDE